MNQMVLSINNLETKRFIETTEELEKKISVFRDNAKLKNFIATTRHIVGKDENEMFSPEDINHVSRKLRLDGVIYLEKFDDRRHVTVLINLNKYVLNLYDPLLGVKVKPYDEIHFGMYCQPVGAFSDEFQAYTQQQGLDKSRNVWTKYRKRGRLLFDFLNRHERFRSMYIDSILFGNDLPVFQNNRSSTDCAPIALYIVALYSSIVTSLI